VRLLLLQLGKATSQRNQEVFNWPSLPPLLPNPACLCRGQVVPNSGKVGRRIREVAYARGLIKFLLLGQLFVSFMKIRRGKEPSSPAAKTGLPSAAQTCS
jgi:hypothetical protein